MRYLLLPVICLFAILLTPPHLRSQGNTPASGDCKCCSESHRAFDFWIGTWQVTRPDGSPAGTNRIEKREGGCVLQENWVGSGGASTGTSLNYFNGAAGHWEQVWVDNSGNILKLTGGLEGGEMVLSSEPFTDASGNERMHRITWSPLADGSVRQHWELLQEGVAVRTLFDGLYRKSGE